MTASARAPFIVAALAALLMPIGVHAQDFERRMPKTPPPPETPQIAIPPDAQPAEDDATQILPELKGLVFVGGPGAVQPDGIAPESVPGGIDTHALPLLAAPGAADQLRPFLGRPLTRGDLNRITRLVQQFYRSAERPFVDVSVPPQKVQSGVVQIVVTEYRIGEVSVTGNRHFSTDLILGMGDLEPGEPITLPTLREALDDYNQNSFLSVNGVVRPGSETGVTDVVLEAKDRFPLRVYAGYDNQGVPTLGRDEWFVGFNWGNVLGTGTLLSYQFTRSFEGRYTSHSASSVIPVNPDDRILLFGAYAKQKPFLGDVFDVEGSSAQASGRYVHDLASGVDANESIQFGMDYKRTDNNLDFFGFCILDSAVEIFQFPLVYTGTFDDSDGRWVLENQLVFSPGNITAHNDDASMRRLVPGSRATYIYNRFSVTRTTYLPHRMSWIVRAMGQYASTNLPYSEQLSGGGLGSVRGYTPNTVLGSDGVLLSTEIRSPVFNLISVGKVKDQLQLGLFLDYAYVRQHKPVPDLPRSSDIASVGFNINYNVDRFLSIQLEVGTQLMRPPFALDRDTRAAIVATIAY